MREIKVQEREAGNQNERPDCCRNFSLFSAAEYTEELYKKDLHDQDNHNGVITHVEPDILECEVKWAIEKHHYEQS